MPVMAGEVNIGQNINTYLIPGGNRAFTPARINLILSNLVDHA